MANSQYKDVSTLLSAFFDKKRFEEGGRYAELHSAWRSIVGDRYAAHSWPDDVSKGILYVEVEHPGWIQLLQFRQAGILESVKRSYPELKLKSIMFRLAKSAPADRGEKPVLEPEPVSVSSNGMEKDMSRALDRAFDEGTVDPEVKSMFQGLKNLVDRRD